MTENETVAAATPVSDEKEVVLEVKDLVVHYVLEEETVEAVNGVSFSLRKGETLGLVGETGAGKTSTVLAILNLFPDPPGVIRNGEIYLCENKILQMNKKQLEKVSGKHIVKNF